MENTILHCIVQRIRESKGNGRERAVQLTSKNSPRILLGDKTPRIKPCAMYNGIQVHLAGCTGITMELYGKTPEILKETRSFRAESQTID